MYVCMYVCIYLSFYLSIYLSIYLSLLAGQRPLETPNIDRPAVFSRRITTKDCRMQKRPFSFGARIQRVEPPNRAFRHTTLVQPFAGNGAPVTMTRGPKAGARFPAKFSAGNECPVWAELLQRGLPQYFQEVRLCWLALEVGDCVAFLAV